MLPPKMVPLPVHMVEVINKLARVQRQLLQDLGREPTPEELARMDREEAFEHIKGKRFKEELKRQSRIK